MTKINLGTKVNKVEKKLKVSLQLVYFFFFYASFFHFFSQGKLNFLQKKKERKSVYIIYIYIYI